MRKISVPRGIINSLGGDPNTGMCRCPVLGHGKGRGDLSPSLWISPEGTGIKCHAGCDRKAVIAAIKAKGITVRYEKRASSKATLPPVNVDLDEAQRFLDLIDPNAESWTFQTFDDNHERTNTRLAKILHGTLKEHAAELKRLSRYGAGIYVCPNQTDGKGRKRQNIIGIRAVSVDLDGSPLGPVQACELTPHAIIKTSSGRYQAHWRAKGLRLDEFEEVTRGVAALFDGDAQIAELSHTCRLPGFEHAKIPTKRFQVRIVEENERPPYTAAKIRKAFPPVAKPASPTSKTTGASGNPLFMSPAGKRAYDEAKTKADKYILPDGSSPKLAAAEEVVGEAAKLGLLSYELDRRALAESVGIRATVLDDLVSERREEDKVVPFLQPDEPWETAVNGHDILDEIYCTIRRYVFMSKYSALACSLWTLFAHTHDAFEFSPRLFIHSPEHRCGKTTLIKVLSGMCPKSLVLVSITPATVFRLTDKYHPTLFFDEGDALNKDTLDQLRGIMNAGHDRESATVPRVEGDSTREVKLFSMWAPKVTARIGTHGVHPTEIDRSIMIAMRRMTKAEKEGIARVPKRIRGAMVDIRRRCTRWANDNIERLRAAQPQLPEALNDRAQNNWEPLLAIADLCDEGALARKVALKLSGEEGDGTKSLSALLLKDIHDIFGELDEEWTPKTRRPYKAIASIGLAARLAEREDRPWAEFGRSGKPITPRGIAKLLEGFQIRPREMPSGANGYQEKQFVRAWERYLSSDLRKNAEN